MSDIWQTVAVHDERAADRLLMKLFDKFDLAARHPEMCPVRPEIAAQARLIIEGNYVAIYETAAHGVTIVAIVHARRDPSTWLE